MHDGEGSGGASKAGPWTVPVLLKMTIQKSMQDASCTFEITSTSALAMYAQVLKKCCWILRDKSVCKILVDCVTNLKFGFKLRLCLFFHVTEGY